MKEKDVLPPHDKRKDDYGQEEAYLNEGMGFSNLLKGQGPPEIPEGLKTILKTKPKWYFVGP